MTDQLAVGVIGVGSMGRNHARVYQELPSVDLIGVADADPRRAREVATEYGTCAMSERLVIDEADAVSIAVPTRYHAETASRAIEEGVHTLVEKPFVEEPATGERLITEAENAGVTLQVGHVERFNPAIRTLADILPDLEIIAIDAMRLGPPINRDITVNPVLDLMIHDIDIVRALLDEDVTELSATGSNGNPYVTAALEFGGDLVTTLTASRITQRKVRTLSVTAREGHVTVDYIRQSVEIHRQSLPEYIEQNGDVRFRHQNIVEQPTVENGEPLKAELQSFVEAATSNTEPIVTGEDGLEALRLARQISEQAALSDRQNAPEMKS